MISLLFTNRKILWREFVKGKKKKADVLIFAADIEERIFSLHDELAQGTYRHGGYVSFLVKDPKLRRIPKACVRDRLLHHAVHRVLYQYFDLRFIFDSYSSRKGKGTHAAIKRFRDFAWTLSRNRTRTVWILKADIRRFFDSIDHVTLLSRLENDLPRAPRLLFLLREIIGSFHTRNGKGIPLGNLTSQLFSNIYFNSLDQFVKRKLGITYYLRYADDFLILSPGKHTLARTLSLIQTFLSKKLALELNHEKVEIRAWHSGVDVLGFILSPSGTVIRSKTLRRMLRRLVRADSGEDFEIQENALYSRMKFER